MSKLCMVTAQLVPWNGMDDEVVSGGKKKRKAKNKREFVKSCRL